MAAYSNSQLPLEQHFAMHRFEPRDGGTLLHDEVRYALPVALTGPLRDLVHSRYVRPTLERIIDYREQVFARLFGGTAKTRMHASPALAREENTA